MADEIVETSSQGWLSRLMESIKEVVIGLLLFVVSFPLLWWNEGRAVQTYQSLQEGAGAVVSVPADKVDKEHEGDLVHVTGKATTTASITDPIFGVQTTAVRLKRSAEMYQWVEEVSTEKKKKVGGSEETIKTYKYKKEWKDDLENSAEFKEAKGHQNPSSMAVQTESWRASPVTLGAFTLSDDLVDRVPGEEKLAITEDMLKAAPAAASDTPPPAAEGDTAPSPKAKTKGKAKPAAKVKIATKSKAKPKTVQAAEAPARHATGVRHVADGEIYIGANPAAPEVGDVRVSFTKVPPADVSIIAAQTGSSFGPYKTKAGDTLELLQSGIKPSAAMFAQAESENETLTWILRLVFFVVMAVGVFLVFRPLAVVADVLPFLGDILGWGLGIVAVALSAPLTLVTIALAWVFYRPVLGIILLAAGVGAFVLVKTMAGKRKAALAPAGASA